MEITIRFNIKPIWLSIGFHGLLFLVGFLLIFRTEEMSSHKSDPIEIQSITQKPSARKGHATKALPADVVPGSHQPSKAISLGSLAMRMDYTRPAQQADDFYQKSEPTRNQFGEAEPADDWDILNPDPRLARFNQYIYNTVQGWLDRDAHLNTRPLYGTVRVKIWFSADGEFLATETVYDAPDPDFQKVVERALRKSFTNPIPKPYLVQNKKFFIERTVVLRN